MSDVELIEVETQYICCITHQFVHGNICQNIMKCKYVNIITTKGNLCNINMTH